MLIDLSRRYGAGSIAQVDLDVRAHRNGRFTSLPLRRVTCWTSHCARQGSGSHDRVQPRRRLQPGPFTSWTVPTGESSSDRRWGVAPSLTAALGEESATSGSAHSGSRQP